MRKTVQKFILLLILALNSLSSNATEDVMTGTWPNDVIKGGTVKITQEDKLYKIYMVSTDNSNSVPGELIGVFTHQDADNKYIGSHKWGGKKDKSYKWGVPNGMEVHMININEIFIVYNDSKYDGGWIYKRVEQ